jgi:iron complex outermembrane receptor protein
MLRIDRPLIPFLLLLFLGMSQTAWCEVSAERYHGLSLEELLNTEVVTAAKHSQKLGDAPSTVTVITADQIQRSGKATLAELLKGVAGMDVLYASERKFAVTARGLSGGTYSKRILFLVNGRPINQPSSGEAYVGFPIALNDIKQVEIIRGPGSSLYGGNAFAAVVQIILKAPGDYARLTETTLSYGSYDRINGAVGIGKKVGNFGLAASASYLAFDEDGIWNKWYGLNSMPDDLEAYDLKGRVDYKTLSVEGGYGHFEMPEGEKGQYTSTTSYMRYEADHLAFGQAQWSPTLTKTISLNVRAYYNDFQVDKYDLYNQPGQIKDAKTGALLRAYEAGDRRWWKTPSDQNSWGGAVQVDWTPNSSNRMIGGVDYLGQSIDQKTLLATNGSYDPSQAYYADKSLSAVGAFVQDEQTFFDSRLIVTGGVRYDKYSDFDPSFSPRLSAIYKLDARAQLRATYGKAFRIPSLAEYYYSLYQLGKLGLDWKLVPERIHTFELAAGYTDAKSQFMVEITGFRNEVPNMIMNTSDRIEERFPMLYFYYNFDRKVVSQGVELEVEKGLGAHLKARANYTYQRARDEDGNPMVEAPENKFNIEATALWGDFSANASLGYVGSRYDRYYFARYVDLTRAQIEHATAKLPSYQVVDMRLSWRLHDHVSLELAARNLLDEKYFDTGHNAKYDTGYLTLDSKTNTYSKVNPATNDYRNRDFLNPGRTIRAELRATF